MIYYPLSVLMLAGIREILIISTPRDITAYQELLGDGHDIGLDLSYKIQPSPDGLAQAFILGESFIGQDRVALVLGDNIFYGQGFTPVLRQAATRETGATVFAYQVKDPSKFAVVEFDNQKNVISLVEKPAQPKTNYAVPGLYFYDNDVINIAKNIKPSTRGELEITDVNRTYMDRSHLFVEILGRGFAWLDTGTFDSLLQASHFVETIENRQGFMIACLEEIAFYLGYITEEDLQKLAQPLRNNEYGQYLLQVAQRPGLPQWEWLYEDRPVKKQIP